MNLLFFLHIAVIAVKKARLTQDSPVPFRAPVSGQYFCEPTYPLLLHLLIVPHDLIFFLYIAVVAVKTAQLSQVSRIPARDPVSGQYLRGTARDLILLCLLIVPCNLIHFLPVAVVAVKKMAQLPQVSLIPARKPVSGQYLIVTTRDPILLNLSTVPLDQTPFNLHISVVAVKTAQPPQVNPIPAREPVSGEYLRGTTSDLILLYLLIAPQDLTIFPSHCSGRSKDGPTSPGQPDSCSRTRIRSVS